MEAATAVREVTTFRSVRPLFTQTLIPADFDINNKGQRYNQTPGLRAEFGRDHIFKTDDPETIRLLRESSNYNLMFFEEGREPDRPLPTVEEQLAEITRAAGAHDVDAINDVVRIENEAEDREIDGIVRAYGGYERPEVLKAAEAVLTAIASE